MSSAAFPATDVPPGLIWAFDFIDGRVVPLEREQLSLPAPAGAFRWIHLDMAGQWTRAWLAGQPRVEGQIRELLLASDGNPHVRVSGDAVAFTIQDFEQDFGVEMPTRLGSMGFVVEARQLISGRTHPLYAPDIICRRIELGAAPATAADAAELLLGGLAEAAKVLTRRVAAIVRNAEDALIDSGRAPDPRLFVDERRRVVLLRRQLDGLRSVLVRADTHDQLPAAFKPVIGRVLQRVIALDADVLQVQSNLRQLREEVDMQTASRTNQNLYVLSILSALLLPPTLVASFFGMNTEGLPFAHGEGGTGAAIVVMAASAIAVFIWLRRRGFFDR